MLCKYSFRTSIYLCLASAAVLPNSAGSHGGAERAGLYGSTSASGLIETFRRWTPASLMKRKSCSSRSLSQPDCDRLLRFLSLLCFAQAEVSRLQKVRRCSCIDPFLEEALYTHLFSRNNFAVAQKKPQPGHGWFFSSISCCKSLRIAFHFSI